MTGSRSSGAAAREALTRQAGVVVTVCLFAWLALLPVHAGVAQDRSGSPTPEKLWKEYPLAPTAAPSAQPNATSSPATVARANRRPLGAADPRSDRGTPVTVLVLFALLTAGATVTFLGIRRRRESEPHTADVPRPTTSAWAVRVVPTLSNGRSGRFTPASARANRSRATAVVASAHKPSGGSRAGGAQPRSEAAAVPPDGDPRVVAAPAPAASPPDRGLAWTAEIEWRHTSGESRFCVIARGADASAVTVAQSGPLEWPPTEPAAVQAMTDAAEKLEATLAAAGWKALPPGHSWYAKRFAWEPVKSAAADEAKVLASSRPAGQAGGAVAAGGRRGQSAPHPVRRRRLQLALLCVLVALGPLAALQLGRGDDDARVARPAPATGTTATPATKANPSSGADLTLPLIVLLGLIPVVLVIRETRRTRR